MVSASQIVKKKYAFLKESNIVLIQLHTMITTGANSYSHYALTDVKHRVVFLSHGG